MKCVSDVMHVFVLDQSSDIDVGLFSKTQSIDKTTRAMDAFEYSLVFTIINAFDDTINLKYCPYSAGPSALKFIDFNVYSTLNLENFHEQFQFPILVGLHRLLQTLSHIPLTPYEIPGFNCDPHHHLPTNQTQSSIGERNTVLNID